MVRRLRLISGLILFAYVVTHFINHGLGIVSIAAMEAMLSVVYPIWSYPPITFVLYGALVIHMTLALYALWQRRSLKLSLHETVQYSLGFSVPLLLAEHVTSTRIDAAFYGGDFGYYKYLLSALWYGDPEKGVLQMVLLLATWAHACIGLRFWLRVQPWYDAVQSLLFAAALLLPVVAILGYVAGTGPGLRGPLACCPTAARGATRALRHHLGYSFRIPGSHRDSPDRANGAVRMVATKRGHAHLLPGRALDRGGAWLHSAGGKSIARRAACRDLRWQRALYDLPRACPRRARRSSRAGSGGASRPAP